MITYFLLALVVLSLNLSFFGVSDSLSLESAEEGESGESRRNLSSLRAWILWGVGGPVWGLEQSSVTVDVEEVGVVGADTVVDVSELTEGKAVKIEHWGGRLQLEELEGLTPLLCKAVEDWSCSSFSAWLRVHTVRTGTALIWSFVCVVPSWPFKSLLGEDGAEVGWERLSWALVSSGFILQSSSRTVVLSVSASSATGGDLRRNCKCVDLLIWCASQMRNRGQCPQERHCQKTKMECPAKEGQSTFHYPDPCTFSATSSFFSHQKSNLSLPLPLQAGQLLSHVYGSQQWLCNMYRWYNEGSLS